MEGNTPSVQRFGRDPAELQVTTHGGCKVLIRTWISSLAHGTIGVSIQDIHSSPTIKSISISFAKIILYPKLFQDQALVLSILAAFSSRAHLLTDAHKHTPSLQHPSPLWQPEA